jgi:hypothetical protein
VIQRPVALLKKNKKEKKIIFPKTLANPKNEIKVKTKENLKSIK